MECNYCDMVGSERWKNISLTFKKRKEPTGSFLLEIFPVLLGICGGLLDFLCNCDVIDAAVERHT